MISQGCSLQSNRMVFFKSHISQRPPKVNFKMKSGRKGSFSQLWCSLLCSHHGPKGDKTYFTSRNLEIVDLLEQGCQTCGVKIYIFMWKGEFSLSPPLTFFLLQTEIWGNICTLPSIKINQKLSCKIPYLSKL